MQLLAVTILTSCFKDIQADPLQLARCRPFYYARDAPGGHSQKQFIRKCRKMSLSKSMDVVARGQSIDALVETKAKLLLVAVLGLALLARLLALISVINSLYGKFLFWDEQVYDTWARSIVAGKPYFLHSLSPLPVYVFVTIYRLIGSNILYVRFLNLLFGVLTCWLIYEIGRLLGGKLTGLLSAFVSALYKPFILFSVTLLKEALGLLLFALMIYLLLSAVKDHHWWKLFLLGFVVGLIINVRQNAGIAIIVIGAAILGNSLERYRSARSAAVAAAFLGIGFLVPSVPFLLENYRGAGQLSPAPQGGFDLYLGNNPASERPFYSPTLFSPGIPAEQGIQFTIEASRREGRKLTISEGSAYWAGQVMRWAIREPREFGAKLLMKGLVAFNRWEESDNHCIDFIAPYVPFFQLPLFAFWLVMPLGMSGLVVSARSDRKARGLLAIVLLYTATLVIFFSNMRIRAPLLVILVPYATITVRKWLDPRISSGRERACLAAVALSFVGIEVLSIPGIGDLSSHYNAHAIVLLKNGNAAEALKYLRISSDLNGYYSASANLSLSGWSFTRGDMSAAQTWLEKISDDSYASPKKYEMMGNIMNAKGKILEATAAYEKSLSINLAQRHLLRKLISAYHSTNSEKAAYYRERLALVCDIYGQYGKVMDSVTCNETPLQKLPSESAVEPIGAE
jgi:4-amino-4-deoxy-L-arabinose transferase-like glycosyltransferase